MALGGCSGSLCLLEYSPLKPLGAWKQLAGAGGILGRADQLAVAMAQQMEQI